MLALTQSASDLRYAPVLTNVSVPTATGVCSVDSTDSSVQGKEAGLDCLEPVPGKASNEMAAKSIRPSTDVTMLHYAQALPIVVHAA